MPNTYEPMDDLGQLQLIDETSTTQQHRVGMIVRASSATYGHGEFIYLKGAASTAAGDCVTWDSAFATTRVTNGMLGPIGFAMSANVANQWGWYQIAGIAIANTAGTVVSGAAVQTASTGAVDDTTTSTRYITGALFRSADGTPSANKALLAIQRPFAQGVVN